MDEPNDYESGRALLIKNEGGMDTTEGDVDEGVFVDQPIQLRSYQNYYNNPNNLPQTRPDTPPPIKTKGNCSFQNGQYNE